MWLHDQQEHHRRNVKQRSHECPGIFDVVLAGCEKVGERNRNQDFRDFTRLEADWPEIEPSLRYTPRVAHDENRAQHGEVSHVAPD